MSWPRRSEDVPGWFRAHNQALEYPFAILVAGPVGRLGTREDVMIQKSYLADLSDSTSTAMAEVDPAAFQRQFAPNLWAVCRSYVDQVRTRAAEPVIAKYADHLAGTDVYTASHTEVMMDTLQNDGSALSSLALNHGH
jgi:hypothetical protein